VETSSDLRRLQLTELRILRELQRICEAHSLRYYLIGGSAIGAIRHKGFIPWDDDIDVGIPRPDYEELERLCRDELGGRFFWQTYRTEPRYNAIFGKLRLNDTLYKETPTAHLPIHHGIKIDVFPLDGVPRRGFTRFLQRVILKFCAMKIGSETRSTRPRSYQARLARMIPRRAAIRMYDVVAGWCSFDESEIVINNGGVWGHEKEAVPRIWFGAGEIVQFEDGKAPVPECWDEYLTQIYGDYMTQPPEDQRGIDRHPVVRIEHEPVDLE
jgi:lipopolysaccharide cholinephosphotransferase